MVGSLYRWDAEIDLPLAPAPAFDDAEIAADSAGDRVKPQAKASSWPPIQPLRPEILPGSGRRNPCGLSDSGAILTKSKERPALCQWQPGLVSLYEKHIGKPPILVTNQITLPPSP